MQKCARYTALVVSLVLVSVVSAGAQQYEDVGTRAQGMAGAFVAVADDGTASWWNPAGLAGGALFDVIFEKGRANQPESPVGLEPARRASTSSFSIGFPSVALSYYRLRVSQIAPIASIEAGMPNRQNLGDPGGRVTSHALEQFGMTVGQSLTDHFVIGTTLKLVRSGVASTVVEGTADGLDAGDDLALDRQTHGSLDVGAMLSFPLVRLGLTIRDLNEPTFGDGSDRLTLKRQARAGVAIVAKPTAALAGFTVSADADLTTSTSPFGDVRHAATGAEAWLLGKRLGLRGGISTNTIGERRTTTSTGVSVAVTKSIYIDAARAFGADDSIRGWSSALRFTF